MQKDLAILFKFYWNPKGCSVVSISTSPCKKIIVCCPKEIKLRISDENYRCSSCKSQIFKNIGYNVKYFIDIENRTMDNLVI